MSIMAELFIEIFTEELPAIPLLKNLSNIKENWKKILKDSHLDAPFDFFLHTTKTKLYP